jgi:protein-S-isoprenylcysteine O-methyltransferase
VPIAEDHELVERGPYRFIHHPSYTGLLMIWLGMGLISGIALTLAALVLPTGSAILRRISLEETVLSETFGSRYADYMRRTWRLIPFVY